MMWSVLLWLFGTVLAVHAVEEETPVVSIESQGRQGAFNSILELVKPYPLQQHYVTTDDGYILSVYRIPHGLSEGTTGWDDASIGQGIGLSSGSSSKDGGGGGRKMMDQADGSAQSGGGGGGQGNGNASSKKGGRPVVLLQHGLLDSCAGFLLQGHDSALAFMLANAGFDVWLGNSRGSTYSRSHVSYPTDSREFWTFSYDEMAAFDLPAMLTYIKGATGTKKVHYVGHSQGTTLMLAALSPTSSTKASHGNLGDRHSPDTYITNSGTTDSSGQSPRGGQGSSEGSLSLSRNVSNDVGLVVLLAPVATAKHVSSIPLQVMSAVNTDTLFTLLGIKEFLPSVQIISWLEGGLCTMRPELCVSILAAICGYRQNATDLRKLPLYLKYTPAGTSVHNMAHWAQAVRGGHNPQHPEFSMFDYSTDCGPGARQGTCNQRKYGQLNPPVYQLDQIPASVRIAMFTGGADMLADRLDTQMLLEELPSQNVVSRVELPEFEHVDFMWAVDARANVYTPVLELLQKEQDRLEREEGI